MIYLKLFGTDTERQACTDEYEYVSYTEETDKVHIHRLPEMKDNYLTLIALEDGTIRYTNLNQTFGLQYSTDDGETWSESSNNITINVNADDKVLWKGFIETTIGSAGSFSGSTSLFDIEGNVMSVLFGDDFADKTAFTNNYQKIYTLFRGSKCVHAHDLILPVTDLSGHYSCYYAMFSGCTSLLTPPELPATVLEASCYEEMFYYCESLTQAPELNAPITKESCYDNMFVGCTSLTSSPVLPAKYVDISAYHGMFSGCTSLNHITMLATDGGNRAFSDWVYNVAATGTFVKDAEMTTLPSSQSGIPHGWTVIDT